MAGLLSVSPVDNTTNTVLFFFFSKKEQQENPEAVVNSLKTYTKSIKRRPSTAKFMMVATAIRESDEGLDSTSSDRSSYGSSKSQDQKSVPSSSDLDSTNDSAAKEPEKKTEEVSKKGSTRGFFLVFSFFTSLVFSISICL